MMRPALFVGTRPVPERHSTGIEKDLGKGKKHIYIYTIYSDIVA
jgi:hypothetical protein